MDDSRSTIHIKPSSRLRFITHCLSFVFSIAVYHTTAAMIVMQAVGLSLNEAGMHRQHTVAVFLMFQQRVHAPVCICTYRCHSSDARGSDDTAEDNGMRMRIRTSMRGLSGHYPYVDESDARCARQVPQSPPEDRAGMRIRMRQVSRNLPGQIAHPVPSAEPASRRNAGSHNITGKPDF